METVAVDPVRDDVDGGKFAASVRAQPSKSALELAAGELREDHEAVGAFERRRILLVRDPAVERDAADDLQPVPIRSENVQVMLEAPDVLRNENNGGVDLFDHPLRLERRKDVAAFRIGR